ncbi:16S rRNA (cytosine(967)-C(5))-methyltransferase, partial [cf. Phormidesmis sp. LEGE 11477]|uniref:16S rRNA (cytosine(967)-C(5))-methyltransferase n=1 Tax=cf. Phormidesmis sp. LEGE 11477 TaxID=1828680 RepID=UPI00188171B5
TQSSTGLSAQDKGLVTELVYGSVRRRRTLDALIDQFGKRPAAKQQSDLLQILRLGFYQLRYLDHVPEHAVVDTTVQLAKSQRLGKLSGVVNGMLRQYIRETKSESDIAADPLKLLEESTQRLGVLHSYPDWIVDVWRSVLPDDQVAALCEYFNQPPHLDLRINLQRQSLLAAIAVFAEAGIEAVPVEGVPSALRLTSPVGAVARLPGYAQGGWAVQDSSAQLVSYLLDPQPGEVIIDACAAPGGKSLHIAEMMQNEGTVWSCDRTPSRTKKIQQNIDRLGATIVRPIMGDSRSQPAFVGQGDRVLLDVPCSGLGTLNRHADGRWRQTPESVKSLVILQQEILTHASTWVKPGGILVYATCTLHPDENEAQIETFLAQNPAWAIEAPPPSFLIEPSEAGWIKVWPHLQQMDGFFMVKLRRATT